MGFTIIFTGLMTLHLKQLLLMICVEMLSPSAYSSRKLQLTNTVLWGKKLPLLGENKQKNNNSAQKIKPLVKRRGRL